MKSLAKKKMVNHVAFLLDASGSMMGLTQATRQTFAKLMDGLATQEKKSGIETRVHIYSFGYGIQAHLTNVTPKEAAAYSYSARNEGTALINSTLELVNRLEEFSSTKEDVSFLVYVLTDGQETENRDKGPVLKRILTGLTDDWTMAIMVPNSGCKISAEGYGFPSDNIQIWETTEMGMETLTGSTIAATQSYYTARCAGIKSTKSLFKFDTDLTKQEVRKTLEEVPAGEYETLIVRPYYQDWAIKDFVETFQKKPYRVGSAYYQVTKPEKIQAGKTIAVIEKSTGKMFSGVKARSLLGLPNSEVKIEPADFAKFDLFVQSNSTNRKLVGDTHLVVFK